MCPMSHNISAPSFLAKPLFNVNQGCSQAPLVGYMDEAGVKTEGRSVLGLDEIVMVGIGGSRNAPPDAMGSKGERSLPCRAGSGWDQRGQARPLSMGFLGKAKFPHWCGRGSMPIAAPLLEGCNGRAQRLPCQDRQRVTLHILRSA